MLITLDNENIGGHLTPLHIKHGLFLIILGKQYQHTFKNYTHIQLSASVHFAYFICF